MPDGHVQRIDQQRGEVYVVRNGRRLVAPLNEVEPAARVPGARVHFDLDRESGTDGAARVRLVSGTRTNKRHRRFGDLTGARRPGAKIKTSSTSRLGVDVTTQPVRVVESWRDAMAARAFSDATSLYAPNAVVHTPGETHVGSKAIRALLEDVVSSIAAADGEIEGADQLVRMRIEADESATGWFEVHRGAIIEHWQGLEPDQLDAADDTPDIAIIRSGDIDASQELRLREDLERVLTRAHGPVERVRVKIDAPQTPSHPYSVSIAVFTSDAHVRSHVTAESFNEAIDTVCLRLRRQLDRSADRRRRPPDQHRPDETSWRHGDRPDPGALISDGPASSAREIVRHKTWGPRRSSIEEAIWDMEQADYDFYLFVEDATNDTAFVSHEEAGVAVQFSGGVSEDQASAASEFASVNPDPAPAMTPDVAMKLLNESRAPFVFAADADGSAFVLYRRFDGHFGLIEPRDDPASAREAVA